MNQAKELRRDWQDQLIPNKRIPLFILQGSISRYIFARRFAQDNATLDIACGSGYGSNYLMSKGAKSVVGGDISEDAIGYAAAHYRRDGLHFLLLNASRLPFPDGSFDVIVSFETLEHVKEHETFLSECRRVLKKGGTFVCSTPNSETSSPDPQRPSARFHVKEFNVGEFRHLVSKYFEEITIYGMDPQEKRDRLIYNLAVTLEPVIFSIPKVHWLINLVTRFIFRRYRLVKLAEMDEMDLDRILDGTYQVAPLQDNSLPPGDMIAVAR